MKEMRERQSLDKSLPLKNEIYRLWEIEKFLTREIIVKRSDLKSWILNFDQETDTLGKCVV